MSCKHYLSVNSLRREINKRNLDILGWMNVNVSVVYTGMPFGVVSMDHADYPTVTIQPVDLTIPMIWAGLI